jgi:hypothetical protein
MVPRTQQKTLHGLGDLNVTNEPNKLPLTSRNQNVICTTQVFFSLPKFVI